MPAAGFPAAGAGLVSPSPRGILWRNGSGRGIFKFPYFWVSDLNAHSLSVAHPPCAEKPPVQLLSPRLWAAAHGACCNPELAVCLPFTGLFYLLPSPCMSDNLQQNLMNRFLDRAVESMFSNAPATPSLTDSVSELAAALIVKLLQP